MNKVILIGRPTDKPELQYTQNTQTPVTKFTLAVNRFGKDNGADFIKITAFGSKAENLCKYSDKGKRIAITGRIQTGSYKDRDGKTIYTTDIILDDFEFLDSKNDPEKRDNNSYHNYGGYSEEPKDYRRFGDDIF